MNKGTLTDARPADASLRLRRLTSCLQRVWTYPITTKSDSAREYADEIAEAASHSYITTVVVPSRTYTGRLWKITPHGLAFLYQHSDIIADDEVENYVQSFCD